MMVEAEVRLQIDQRLKAKGWTLEPENPGRNVFVERSVFPRLSRIHQLNLGKDSPDYTFFSDGHPVAVLEAKKPRVSIHEALVQGSDYAESIGVDYVFACNGPLFKTLHAPTKNPLYLNKLEVSDPLPPVLLRKFRNESTNDLLTVPQAVITSRKDLIDIFERVNETLRTAGIRAGLDRFTEFANVLFLKLLSEDDRYSELWAELLRKKESKLPQFLNRYVLRELQAAYDRQVLSRTHISGRALKSIVNELHPLRLSSVDDDIKGVAFEHFLKRTTSVQNDLGEYFTPRHVVRFMVLLLDPAYGKTIYDPFCGTGGFLTEAFRYLTQQVRMTDSRMRFIREKSLFGQEITKNSRIAKMNMILIGDGHSGVEQGDSLQTEPMIPFDYVLSNIPFSLKVDKNLPGRVDPIARDADEACLLRCFNSLRDGGSMAVVVPDGLVVNKSHRPLWRHLCSNSKVRAIASLPRKTFAPYTDAGTRILYLTDKGVGRTKWHYDVILETGFRSISMDEFRFFYHDVEDPPDTLPDGVEVVQVGNLDKESSFYMRQPWHVRSEAGTVSLSEVARIKGGKNLTQKNARPGSVPVIGGGAGRISCLHDESNFVGPCFTVSSSGAYSGYVWWHEGPLWASDCMVVRSRNESEFLTFYLYLCMKSRQEEIYARQQGTGQPHVYEHSIADFPIPLIPVSEQRQLVDAARDAIQRRLAAERDEESAVEHALEALRAL